MNDTAFAEDDDSGSIYYASRGSFHYPFAIHNGVGYEKMQIPTTGLFHVPEKHVARAFVTRKVYYGPPLRYALKNMDSAAVDEEEEDEEDLSQKFSWLLCYLLPMKTAPHKKWKERRR